MKKELRKCDKNESTKKSHIHAHETQPFKRKLKKIFCFVYMYSQRMFYNWMYDMYIYNYSLFYLNKN